jgi:hypothetical protein
LINWYQALMSGVAAEACGRPPGAPEISSVATTMATNAMCQRYRYDLCGDRS